jgi:hypothetical protein
MDHAEIIRQIDAEIKRLQKVRKLLAEPPARARAALSVEKTTSSKKSTTVRKRTGRFVIAHRKDFRFKAAGSGRIKNRKRIGEGGGGSGKGNGNGTGDGGYGITPSKGA